MTTETVEKKPNRAKKTKKRLIDEGKMLHILLSQEEFALLEEIKQIAAEADIKLTRKKAVVRLLTFFHQKVKPALSASEAIEIFG